MPKLRIARVVRAARIAALMLVAGGAALASETAIATIPTTPGLTYKMYDSGHFSRFNSDTQFTYVLGGLTVTAGTPSFGQTLDLPGGAAVEEITFFFVDNGPETISFTFTSVPADALAGTLHGSADTTGIQTDGILSATISGSPLTTIDNSQRLYRIEMDLPAGGSSEYRLQALRVGYRLQVSVPPATATFNDVPVSDSAFQFIEALAASGITAGCGGGNFCPDATLTRRQMAVFLAKGLGLSFP
jgi:hypothetical protein